MGVVAHISGLTVGGPRFDAEITEADREGLGNLLLLCYEHHRTIDSNSKPYSCDFLRGVKAAHEGHYLGGREPSDQIARSLQATVEANRIDGGSMILAEGQSGGQAAHTIINLSLPGLGDSLPKDDQLVFRAYDFFSYFMGQDRVGRACSVPREQAKWINYTFRIEVFNTRSINVGLMDIFLVFERDGVTLHREVPGQDTGEIRFAQRYCPPLRSLNLPSNHWTSESFHGGLGAELIPTVADCDEIVLTASTVDGHTYRCPLGKGIGQNKSGG
jgi:hypothetical protein